MAMNLEHLGSQWLAPARACGVTAEAEATASDEDVNVDNSKKGEEGKAVIGSLAGYR